MKLFSAGFLRPAAMFSLLIVLLATTTHQKIYSRSWHEPLDITIYPINGDGTLETHNYILSLDAKTFSELDDWFARESRRHQLSLNHPIRTSLGPQVKAIPPIFPAEPGMVNVLLWGLKMRYWVFRNTPDENSNLRRVRIFVAYYQGEEDKPLQHSVGLEKGLIGMVHAFALPEQTAQNNIVIAHELLHTVGASDKYDSFGNPAFPSGYANPDRHPRYPQRYAEIMAGRIPLSNYNSYMASSLKSTRINELTASEIAWLD